VHEFNANSSCQMSLHDAAAAFCSLKENEMSLAGQGVVQFARRLDGSHTSLFAIKFFASRRDYVEEVKVYRSSPLRSFMPRVLHLESNENQSIQDPFGGLMHPFIVMEKGESLQERGCIDVFTAAQVPRIVPDQHYSLIAVVYPKTMAETCYALRIV
jgi:hypothetical protein